MNKLICFLISTAFFVFLSGLTISVLWEWFVVSIFTLPILTIPQAAGLGILLSYITVQRPNFDNRKGFYEELGEAVFFQVTMALMSLGIGWLLI